MRAGALVSARGEAVERERKERTSKKPLMSGTYLCDKTRQTEQSALDIERGGPSADEECARTHILNSSRPGFLISTMPSKLSKKPSVLARASVTVLRASTL